MNDNVKKGGRKKMCMKLKELNGLSADDLLIKTGQVGVVPVDIAQMCRDLQIIIKPFDFSTIERDPDFKKLISEHGNILGIVLTNNDDLAILYREADTRNRKRFTLAHEMAHCCLHMSPHDDVHIEFRTDKSAAKKEREANIFAGELLIPEKSLRTIIEGKEITNDFIVFLSNLFVVSVNVMIERLRYLKIKI